MQFIRSFLAGIVDYAGLFPPAALNMETAVRNYSEYRGGPDYDLLGRFVVPAAGLDEFSSAARPYLERRESSGPWRVSALVSDDLSGATKTILRFNSTHAAGLDGVAAVCDSIELHAGSDGDITRAARTFSRSFRLFFEIAPEPDPVSLLESVARNTAAAKIRTGGVTDAAFPSSSEIAHFIAACNRLGLRFKATAGLHHVLTGDYPLTYERGSARARMFGYLNLFLAAALIRKGADEREASELLEEQSFGAFTITETALLWRERELTAEDLKGTRAHLALSFGSCSFREPVDEVRALHLI